MENIYLAVLKFESPESSNNSFCGKKDAFDCAGIRAQIFRLPVDDTRLMILR